MILTRAIASKSGSLTVARSSIDCSQQKSGPNTAGAGQAISAERGPVTSTRSATPSGTTSIPATSKSATTSSTFCMDQWNNWKKGSNITLVAYEHYCLNACCIKKEIWSEISMFFLCIFDLPFVLINYFIQNEWYWAADAAYFSPLPKMLSFSSYNLSLLSTI